MSESQIYSRLRTPEFKAQYGAARQEVLEGCVRALQGRLGDAIEVMGEICADAEVPAQTRLNAADAIVRNSLKLTEQVDILARLMELERQIGEAHE